MAKLIAKHKVNVISIGNGTASKESEIFVANLLKDIPVKVEYLEDNMIRLTYGKAKAVTPGQFCVLYDGDKCLGGGIIDKVYK